MAATHRLSLSGPSLSTPEPALPTGSNPEGKRGIQAVMALGDIRKLWLGQIFSQLADKFYIVLMVFLIDQHLLVMGGGGTSPEDLGRDVELLGRVMARRT